MTRQQASLTSFGSIRKLPSGRYQARYPDPAGNPRNAPTTFPTKREAQDHIAGVRADRMRRTYRDHRARLQPFGPYAAEWVANGGTRGRLAAKTQALYEDLLAGPLAGFHDRALSAITPADVRTWYARTRKALAKAVKNRPGATGEARLRQAYSLLRTILNAAVKDRLISENPCQIEGAGQVKDPERPYLSPEHLATIGYAAGGDSPGCEAFPVDGPLGVAAMVHCPKGVPYTGEALINCGCGNSSIEDVQKRYSDQERIYLITTEWGMLTAEVYGRK